MKKSQIKYNKLMKSVKNKIHNYDVTEATYIINKNRKYFSSEDINLLINEVTKLKSEEDEKAYFIYRIFCDVDLLSHENNDLLIGEMAKTKDLRWIVQMLIWAENLRDKNIEPLVRVILESNDLYFIYQLVSNKNVLSNLDIETEELLLSKVIETNDANTICILAINANWLNKEHKNMLTRAIVETEKAKFICSFICNVHGLSETNVSDLINAMLKTKNMIYIAGMLYVLKDYKLTNEIFGSLENYILYCSLNKHLLKNIGIEVDIKSLTKKMNNVQFTYVDDNIDKYLEKGSKKVLSE